MSLSLGAVAAVRELLMAGAAGGDAPFALAEPTCLGLWNADAVTKCFVARATLIKLAGQLPNVDEAVAAVFACQPELRTPWLRIVAARLRESGKRRHVGDLCNGIDRLDGASRRIREELPKANLEPTGHEALESALFGAPAEQAVVWPKLLRAIGATAELVEGGLGHPAAPLPPVDPLDPPHTWCSGRILQLPWPTGAIGLQDHLPPAVSQEDRPRFVLIGNCGPLTEAESSADDSPSQALLRWVLYRPWITLLAQIAFVQEAWEAEQISGRLSLELAEDQLGNPYEPGRLDVVVSTPEGDEVLCGTLGELIQRVLARLDVTLLARPEEEAHLDERLAGVIRVLLERRVWRFEPQAAGRRRPGLVIDDDFSTSCYRAFGSKYFYRLGSLLTAAIRSTCEQWARERLADAGSVVGRDVPTPIAQILTD
jgi:hypothetical protein